MGVQTDFTIVDMAIGNQTAVETDTTSLHTRTGMAFSAKGNIFPRGPNVLFPGDMKSSFTICRNALYFSGIPSYCNRKLVGTFKCNTKNWTTTGCSMVGQSFGKNIQIPFQFQFGPNSPGFSVTTKDGLFSEYHPDNPYFPLFSSDFSAEITETHLHIYRLPSSEIAAMDSIVSLVILVIFVLWSTSFQLHYSWTMTEIHAVLVTVNTGRTMPIPSSLCDLCAEHWSCGFHCSLTPHKLMWALSGFIWPLVLLTRYGEKYTPKLRRCIDPHIVERLMDVLLLISSFQHFPLYKLGDNSESVLFFISGVAFASLAGREIISIINTDWFNAFYRVSLFLICFSCSVLYMFNQILSSHISIAHDSHMEMTLIGTTFFCAVVSIATRNIKSTSTPLVFTKPA